MGLDSFGASHATADDGLHTLTLFTSVKLFLAPFAASLFMQQYQLRLTRMIVYMEAIFTQLVLKHALRVRVVAETKTEAVPTPATTPSHSKAPSIAPSTAGSDQDQAETSGSGSGGSESGHTAAESEATTVVAAAPPAAGKEVAKDLGKGAADAGQSGKSLIGRMNNLISSDLQAIGKATEFIQIVIATPLMVFGTIAFLYTILGWRYVLTFFLSSYSSFGWWLRGGDAEVMTFEVVGY